TGDISMAASGANSWPPTGRTTWPLTMQDAAWGLLDGMNDAGLAVSLTFGGRFVHGPGFAILIVLRYLLETCNTVDANHQHLPVPDEQEQFSRTQERLRAVRAAGTDVAAMLKPPLYQSAYDEGLGTVYTARYRPSEGRVTYYWPDESWEQSFDGFAPGSRTVTIGRAG
ncbi:carcinine hydrolase/isopenicillin-N N-acyltransferase family protein, partial [Streptomyces scabiei]